MSPNLGSASWLKTGVKAASELRPEILSGTNWIKGALTCQPVADAFEVTASEAIGYLA